MFAFIFLNYNTLTIILSISDLELGELLHGYFFGLFEAMSAIEIMDPKMDAGMMCNRESKAIKVNFTNISYLENKIMLLIY